MITELVGGPCLVCGLWQRAASVSSWTSELALNPNVFADSCNNKYLPRKRVHLRIGSYREQNLLLLFNYSWQGSPSENKQ